MLRGRFNTLLYQEVSLKYIKIMLTIIAVLLLAILIKPKLSNEAKAGATTDVNIVQVAGRYISRVPVSLD